MLQTLRPGDHTHNSRSFSRNNTMADVDNRNEGSDDDEGGKGNSRTKSRRELPAGAVATLKAWLLSPEHFTHPYPTPQDQVMLMQKTGIDKKQLKNWFTNARRRIWKPMLKKQLEQGKLAATGGGGVAVPGVVPGLMVPTMSSGMDGQLHYQQPVQPTQQSSEIQHQVCSLIDQIRILLYVMNVANFVCSTRRCKWITTATRSMRSKLPHTQLPLPRLHTHSTTTPTLQPQQPCRLLAQLGHFRR